MFDTQKFGIYLARLRKNADMTQSELAEKLNVTRQAVSGYEVGDSNVKAENPDELVNLAPLLKPSVVGKLAEGLATQGIDISALQKLADYLNDESLIRLFETADFEKPDEALLEKLEKFVPLMGYDTQLSIFERILDGKMDWHFIRLLMDSWSNSHIEAAVVAGVLPWETLDFVRKTYEKRRKAASSS